MHPVIPQREGGNIAPLLSAPIHASCVIKRETPEWMLAICSSTAANSNEEGRQWRRTSVPIAEYDDRFGKQTRTVGRH
jgi:hypothetical protein